MSKKSFTLLLPDNPVYDYYDGRRKYRAVVIPVYKDNGENLCDTLIRLICNDNGNDHKTT